MRRHPLAVAIGVVLLGLVLAMVGAAVLITNNAWTLWSYYAFAPATLVVLPFLYLAMSWVITPRRHAAVPAKTGASNPARSEAPQLRLELRWTTSYRPSIPASSDCTARSARSWARSPRRLAA